MAAWASRPWPSGMIASRRAPHDEGRDALGQVGAVQHGDDLAAPVDTRAEGAQDRLARLGVGQRLEHREDLLRVTAEGGVEHTQCARTEAGGPRTGGRPRSGMIASTPGTAAMRRSGLTVRPTPPLPTSTRRSQRSGNWYANWAATPPPSEWPTTVTRSTSSTLEEVAHPVGEAGDGVVGSRLPGSTVPEQVGRNDGVVLGQLPDDRAPGVRAVPDAVDEEQRRAPPHLHVGAAVAVDGGVAHAEAALAADTRSEAERSGVDGRGGAPGRSDGSNRLVHAGLPFWSAGPLVRRHRRDRRCPRRVSRVNAA